MVRETIELELNVARIFHKVLNKARIIEIFEKKDYELLGQMLYKILTATEKVRVFFVNILAEVIRDKDTRCRFFLEFLDNTYELASLPWEYLYVPYNNERRIGPLFIGADPRNQFELFRFLKSDYEVKDDFNPDKQTGINVVLVYVNATDNPIDELGLKNMFKEISQNYSKQRKGGVVSHAGFKVYPIRNPTRKNIHNKISEKVKNIEGPYILHFMGHAEMKQDGSYVGLVNQHEKIDWMDADRFIDLFDHQRLDPIRFPSMVLLQACESGQIDEKGNGLGVGLVRRGISTVVAMQNEITEGVSSGFVKKFYQWLMEGDDVFHAVSKGRYFLGCEYSDNSNANFKPYNTNIFGTPVIFYNKVMNPLRFMPREKSENQEIGKIIKRCVRCTREYVNTSLDRCDINFCGGELVPVKASTVVYAGSSAFYKSKENTVSSLSAAPEND